jgi:hypothetical protein
MSETRQRISTALRYFAVPRAQPTARSALQQPRHHARCSAVRGHESEHLGRKVDYSGFRFRAAVRFTEDEAVVELPDSSMMSG